MQSAPANIQTLDHNHGNAKTQKVTFSTLLLTKKVAQRLFKMKKAPKI